MVNLQERFSIQMILYPFWEVLPQSRAGGQGPYLRSVEHLGRSGIAKNPINAEKVKCDGPTDGRTDKRTDGRTDKAGCRVA